MKVKNSNLADLNVVEALQGLKEKRFSSRELIEACLERIRKLDPTIKAFLTVCEKEALLMGQKADRLIAQKGPKAFLAKSLLGVPYSAKDVFCTKNIRTTASSRVLANYLPPYSATAVERLEGAGAILIGKTNCDPFGFGSSTENSGFQVTKNPWNLKKVAGGSSGGSAAAVSCGMGLFSLAEDTGGSIRQPSSFCSVSGIKVSYGRVSRFGVIAYGSSLDTIGLMAKTVADLSVGLRVVAGPDPKDATTLKEKVPDYSSRLDSLPRGLKMGLPKEYFQKGIDWQVKELTEKAVKVFEDSGLRIKEVSLPHTRYGVPAYYLAAMAEASSNLGRYDGIRFGQSRALFEPEVKRRIMLGTYALSSGYYEAFYKKAMQLRTLLKKDFERAFRKVDVLLAPVSPFPAFGIGEKSDNPLAMWLADVYTVTINPAGVPALALPCGFTKESLPVGTQIIGPQLSEPLLFSLGHLYQQKTFWHRKRPVIVNSTNY